MCLCFGAINAIFTPTMFWQFLCQLGIFLKLDEIKAFILHENCVQVNIVAHSKPMQPKMGLLFQCPGSIHVPVQNKTPHLSESQYGVWVITDNLTEISPFLH